MDLDNLDGGWANAGRDFRVDRARGDCDMTDDPYLALDCPGRYQWRRVERSTVEERKIKITTHDALESLDDE